jgi:hypothetical protein
MNTGRQCAWTHTCWRSVGGTLLTVGSATSLSIAVVNEWCAFALTYCGMARLLLCTHRLGTTRAMY